MEGLGNHRLADFVLFSREALYSVFESYNADIWPAQLVWLVLSAGVFFLLIRYDDTASRRIIFAILAGAWLWVGLAFHYTYFLPINWAATYFAGLFVAEALLLLAFGVFSDKFESGNREGTQFAIGAALFVVSAFVPLLFGERTWQQVLLFGWGPDHTALGTIGVLLMVKGRWRFALLISPVIWCAVAGAIYYGAR